MTGRLISRAAPQHYCNPGCREVGITGWPEVMPPGSVQRIDDSSKFRDGDIWECDECGRRWTLKWKGPVHYGRSVRMRACTDDWVPESNRRLRRRMKPT